MYLLCVSVVQRWTFLVFDNLLHNCHSRVV